MSRRLESIIEALPDFRSVEDLRMFSDMIRGVYDVDHVVYVVVNFGGGPLQLDYEFAEISYDPSWQEHYFKEDYKAVDPTATAALQSFTPVDWKRMNWRSPKARKMILEAVDAGVGNQGYTVPIRGPNGQFAVLTVNKKCADGLWQRFVAETANDWLLVANFMHQKTLEIFELSAPEDLPNLSPRERDSLALISAGLTRGEIADRLDITENTLRVYLDSARNKLGGLNMPHAVALAVRSGVIDL